MKIHLYTLCYNEIDIIPWAIDYWKRFAEKAVVYDNGSTDGSIEYLSQFDWIEVRHFDSNGLDDEALIRVKNTAWKESKEVADWVVVCDMDECIFSKDIFSSLQKYNSEGYTLIWPKWYNFVGEYKPEYKGDGKLLHDVIENVCELKNNGKCVIFNPNKIQEINYSIGAHIHRAVGELVKEIKFIDDIILLHIDRGFGEEYKIKRFKMLSERMSEKNKRYGWGYHYNFSEEKIRSDYQKARENSINIKTVLQS